MKRLACLAALLMGAMPQVAMAAEPGYSPPVASAYSFPARPVLLSLTATLVVDIEGPADNPDYLNGVSIGVTLPAGLTFATPGTEELCGGTLTVTSGGFSLTGASVAPSDICEVVLDIVPTAAGHYEVDTTAPDSIEGGAGEPVSFTIDAYGLAAPDATISFGDDSLDVGQTTSLTFGLMNPNAPDKNSDTSLHGIGFTDDLPAGLRVATPNGLTGTCGGGTITAVAGTGRISLSGAGLGPLHTCSFSVDVVAVSGGTADNSTWPVDSNEGGAGAGTAATASLTVAAPPGDDPTPDPPDDPSDGDPSADPTATPPPTGTASDPAAPEPAAALGAWPLLSLAASALTVVGVTRRARG